jgi:hypothetical protein
MFRRVRDLFKKDELLHEELELDLDQVSGWLGDREDAIRTDLAESTAPARQGVSDAIERLRLVIGRMSPEDGDAAVHPRLKDISRKTLPQFTRSMNQILSRDLAGDPETFYATAADILKGAIRMVQGQGKYLASLYPDEMKEVREGIRVLGREVNSMTETIGRAREDLKQISDIRELSESLSRNRAEYASSYDQFAAYETTLLEESRAIEAIEEKLAAMHEHPEYPVRQELEARIRDLNARRGEIDRRAASVISTAHHVFRKAEKVAEKAGDKQAVAALHRILDAYAGSIPEQDDEVRSQTEAALAVTLPLIQREEVALKNKEEIRLFSDPDSLPAELESILAQHKEIRQQLIAAQETRDALSSVMEEHHLRAALAAHQHTLDEVESGRSRMQHQLQALEQSFARQSDELRDRITTFAHRDITLHLPVLPPPPS